MNIRNFIILASITGIIANTIRGMVKSHRETEKEIKRIHDERDRHLRAIEATRKVIMDRINQGSYRTYDELIDDMKGEMSFRFIVTD